MPQFYLILARKIPVFYMIFFLGGGRHKDHFDETIFLGGA